MSLSHIKSSRLPGFEMNFHAWQFYLKVLVVKWEGWHCCLPHNTSIRGSVFIANVRRRSYSTWRRFLALYFIAVSMLKAVSYDHIEGNGNNSLTAQVLALGISVEVGSRTLPGTLSETKPSRWCRWIRQVVPPSQEQEGTCCWYLR